MICDGLRYVAFGRAEVVSSQVAQPLARGLLYHSGSNKSSFKTNGYALCASMRSAAESSVLRGDDRTNDLHHRSKNADIYQWLILDV